MSVAIVTGGTSGLDAAIAALLREVAKVIVAAAFGAVNVSFLAIERT